MSFEYKINKCVIATGLSFICSGVAFAESDTLDEVVVYTAQEINSDPLSKVMKANDILVDRQKLKSRSGTLGNALSGEVGVHSSQFGGGASSPIIRGQEGVRLKVLSNGSDVIDMADLSPDHNHGVDTLLSSKVEIVRGAATLLYANASSAGVINVVDERIPTYVPESIEGGFSLRYNTNSREKLSTVGLRVGISDYLAINIEGLQRNSENYKVPEFNLGKNIDYVPDTQNKTKSGSIGFAIISDKVSIGASASTRTEKYGIPGHNHLMDTCHSHIKGENSNHTYYLGRYPHLMDDADMINAHFDGCGVISDDHGHSHDNPYGHKHDFATKGPNVVSSSNRKDFKIDFNQPVEVADKIKFQYSTTTYHHDEKDGDVATNIFNNKGHNTRLEFFHTPVAGFSGVVGVQFQKKTSDANIPRRSMCSNMWGADCTTSSDPNIFLGEITEGDRKHWALIPNATSQLSFFAAEKFENDSFVIDAAIRTEKQKIRIDYDEAALRDSRRSGFSRWSRYNPLSKLCSPTIRVYKGFWDYDEKPNPDYDVASCDNKIDGVNPLPNLSYYNEWATSYAASVLWKFKPHYGLSFTYSHNERHPAPMELYYHGNHVATSSFEHGNKNLTKEISNNYEINTFYQGKKWSYNFSAYYNRFDNRIFNQTLDRAGNLLLNRYAQSKAVYYGFEGKFDYNVTDDVKVGIFGDYVRGRLFDLSPRLTRTSGRFVEYVEQPDQNAPRVPAARLGLRAEWNINDNILADIEYQHVFKQNKVAPLENKTEGYDVFNLGLSYKKSFKNSDVSIFLKVNNVFDEKIYSHSSHLPFVPQMGRNVFIGTDISF